MIPLSERDNVITVLRRACESHGLTSMLAVPPNPDRAYHPRGFELGYRDALTAIEKLMTRYSGIGYGPGHRVGLMLDNRPEHFLHKLALNAIGACCVPVNADYRQNELEYLIEHSKVDAVIMLERHRAAIDAAARARLEAPVLIGFERFDSELRAPRRRCERVTVTAQMPASILYTSGTTGRPKGCVLSQRYELAAGAWYARLGHALAIDEGHDRLYNPLPVHHVNSSILSFWCMVLSGGCQIQAERFQPSRWWRELVDSRATIVHYLGVVVQMLMNQPTSELERAHRVRFGLGAGVEPQLHARFEERFGFPLVEIWGMTEIVRLLAANEKPRQVGTRAFGRSKPGLEVRVVDDSGLEVGTDEPGEMWVRHSEEQPRKDFFTEYLDDPQATETAWQGGWFHTGDIVTRDAGGMLHFVDRRKNIIRRSGENIAAAEVEAQLLDHPRVRGAAVLAVRDELREEEVLACVVPDVDDLAAFSDEEREALARELFDFCRERLAYYKLPGWVMFRDEIPTTGSQKIQKHRLIEADADPSLESGLIDLRALKKRAT